MIRRYRESDRSAVIDLVLRIQNGEYHLGLSLSDQPDMDDIDATYRQAGGDFWVADESGEIIGCIGLLPISTSVAVLKKFFVESRFRGSTHGVSSALFSELISHARSSGLDAIILDTPSVATRSHAFYRRSGFLPISKEALPVPYDYPDRDSMLFILHLKS